jgi:hypothetical protein
MMAYVTVVNYKTGNNYARDKKLYQRQHAQQQTPLNTRYNAILKREKSSYCCLETEFTSLKAENQKQ